MRQKIFYYRKTLCLCGYFRDFYYCGDYLRTVVDYGTNDDRNTSTGLFGVIFFGGLIVISLNETNFFFKKIIFNFCVVKVKDKCYVLYKMFSSLNLGHCAFLIRPSL